MTISKKEWEKRGLPEIYYYITVQDVGDMNKYLSLVPYSTKQEILDIYRKSRDEYLAKEKTF